MLMTETLYSLRKRAMRRPRGSMRSWLQFHIVTGIVGSYLVVLHSAWSFNGLAGVLTLMTVVVVISGFIGRYIYTAMPRTADGVVIEAQVLQRQLDAVRLAERRPSGAGAASVLFAGGSPGRRRRAGCASSSGSCRRSAGRAGPWRRGTRSTSRWAWRCS